MLFDDNQCNNFVCWLTDFTCCSLEFSDELILQTFYIVPELTPVYLLKVTGSFMGISEKGIPLGIWNSTAGEPQPGHKAKINPFSRFRWNLKYRKLMR